MVEIEFSVETGAPLHYARRYHPHSRVRQRMAVVYLPSLGYQPQEIGHIAGISPKTRRNYLRLHQSGGIATLKGLNFYRPKVETKFFSVAQQCLQYARPILRSAEGSVLT